VVTHAAVGPLTGEQAFHRLLSLRGGQFQVKPFKLPPQRTIDSRWEFLLMDAARASDEETVRLKNPAPNKPISPSAPAKPEHGALGDDIVVVATYDGKWKPEDGAKK
jgi:hypothetical protein